MSEHGNTRALMATALMLVAIVAINALYVRQLRSREHGNGKITVGMIVYVGVKE